MCVCVDDANVQQNAAAAGEYVCGVPHVFFAAEVSLTMLGIVITKRPLCLTSEDFGAGICVVY